MQIGMVVFTYMAAYAFMYLISLGLDSLGGFFADTIKPLIWGFNFLIGTGGHTLRWCCQAHQ